MESSLTFGVIRTRIAAWQPDLALEQQADWRAHAAFMNGLHRGGFIARIRQFSSGMSGCDRSALKV
jgi:hypothetical protein